MNNKAVRLDQLVELRIEKISAGKDQSKPYIGLEHLGPGCSGLLGWSGAGDSVSVNSIFRSGDILFGKLRPNLRKCERVSFDGYCSTDILVLRARQGVDPGFAARVVQSVQVFNEAARSAEGTKMPRTSWSKLRWFAVPWVPLPEQRRIGEILDTVDEAIRSTERLIAKLEQAKQGLLHDLLTCGLDETGYLRDPSCRRDQFVETPLGLLPAAWDVEPIGELLASVNPAMRSGPFGSALLKSELMQDGIPLLGIDNVETERFVQKYSRFVSEEKYAELARYAVRPRDVMVTIMGTVGRCCVVPDGVGPALSSKHVWTLTFDHERYLPELICLQVNYSDWVLRHFACDAQGGIMSAIRSETLRTTLLPVPPITEQRKINAVLRSEQVRIDVACQELAKLSLLKQGLMDDLLTGGVRVNVEEEVSA